MRTRALTLIEIVIWLVVVSLIAFGIFHVTSAFIKYIKKKATEKELQEIAKGLVAYYLDIGSFPTSLTYLVVWDGNPNWQGPYVSSYLDSVSRDEFGYPYAYTFTEFSAVVVSGGKDGVCETPLSSNCIPSPCPCPAGGWPNSVVVEVDDDLAVEITAGEVRNLKIKISLRKLKAVAKAIKEYFYACSVKNAPPDCMEYAVFRSNPFVAGAGSASCVLGISPCIAEQGFPPGHGIGGRGGIPDVGGDFTTPSGFPIGEPNQPNSWFGDCSDGPDGNWLYDESTEEIILKNPNPFDPFIRQFHPVEVFVKSFWWVGANDEDCQYVWYSPTTDVANFQNIGCAGGAVPATVSAQCAKWQGLPPQVGMNVFRYVFRPSSEWGVIRTTFTYVGANSDCGTEALGLDPTCPSGGLLDNYLDIDALMFRAVPPNWGNCFPKSDTWYVQLGLPTSATLDAWGKPMTYVGCDITTGPGYPPAPDCQDLDFPSDPTDPPFEAAVCFQDDTGKSYCEIVTATPTAGQCQETTQVVCTPGSAITLDIENDFSNCTSVYETQPNSTAWTTLSFGAGGSYTLNPTCGNLAGVHFWTVFLGFCIAQDGYPETLFFIRCPRMAFIAGAAGSAVMCYP